MRGQIDPARAVKQDLSVQNDPPFIRRNRSGDTAQKQGFSALRRAQQGQPLFPRFQLHFQTEILRLFDHIDFEIHALSSSPLLMRNRQPFSSRLTASREAAERKILRNTQPPALSPARQS